MVFGTPGGETIGQTEFQMLLNVLDFHIARTAGQVERRRLALDDAKPNFYKTGSAIAITIEDRVSQSVATHSGTWAIT